MFPSAKEKNSWYPQVGDMIVVYPRHLEPHEDGYVGTIRSRGQINGSDTVQVLWSNPDHIPHYYNESMGYLVTNIHNLPHEFQLFRAGKKVRDVEPRW
jgi:hypothetical protein